MKRTITQKLVNWKQSKNRKPLLVFGARQVGKTFSIRDFGQEYYDHCIEINFERDLEYVSLFKKTHNSREILEYIKLNNLETDFKRQNILIFFDEIQACPDCLTSLKFIKEDWKHDVIASGSLLGVAIAKSSSFPVGYVESLSMHPLGFIEFIEALSMEQSHIEQIYSCIQNKTEIPFYLHDKLNELFDQYMVVGGLPEVVQTYIETKDLTLVHKLQQQLLSNYTNDIAKYANNSDKIKAYECFMSIPAQLAKENKKFQYSLIKKGYNARHFEASLTWLSKSGLVDKVLRLSRVELPYEGFIEHAIFKIYLFDTGLLFAQFGFTNTLEIINQDLKIYKGVLYENICSQILKYYNKEYYYYEPNSSSEIDVLTTYNQKICAMEIKGGYNTQSKSFNNFVNRHKPTYAFRFSKKNIGLSNDSLSYLPLYCLPFILELENKAY